ncbi:MAG: hypothetical protein NTV01_11475, partial [Bacteroidia bacterium]|nr:hypothetical protein [Bacteroidia bacterium]
MKRVFNTSNGFLLLILIFIPFPCLLSAQSFNFGWSGTDLVPKSIFLNPSSWTTNVPNAGLGDRSLVSAAGDTLKLSWTLGTGNRYKWAQCYLYLPQTISLANYDLFGFNLKGLPGSGYAGFELKFEDGTHQAVVRWDGLAGLNRWAEKISAAKKQFENSASMDWSQVRVISLAVYAQASAQYVNTDQGSVSILNLVGTRMADWERAASREFINPMDFVTIKENAIAALVSRQKSTGLLTTWTQDGTSWLYGQGLALKALSIEGTWSLGVPDNASAVAAEKLALFLAANQEPQGYWPRAWNSESGAITVLREADGTVWMGDFPWIITGLQSYFKKSADQRVIPAIQNGLEFLRNLILPDGKFFTVNPQTGIKSEVASCEAYAAAILSLYESGDITHANSLLSYISTNGWDSQLRCWREATYSDRIVLFANTWMSYYLFQQGETQMGLDALSLAGKVLYTHGNGELYGMDGIVPLAVWYEGTLSYIAAGGPGSISLFEEIRNHIHPDGMVSHYNENLGMMGGIWAVDWHSLDGTSWLYFTAAGSSPFDIKPGVPAK